MASSSFFIRNFLDNSRFILIHEIRVSVIFKTMKNVFVSKKIAILSRDFGLDGEMVL